MLLPSLIFHVFDLAFCAGSKAATNRVFVLFCGGLVGASGDAILAVLSDVQGGGGFGGHLGGVPGELAPTGAAKKPQKFKKGAARL